MTALDAAARAAIGQWQKSRPLGPDPDGGASQNGGATPDADGDGNGGPAPDGAAAHDGDTPRVGVVPAWNAVSLLNPAAAAIWDALCDSPDPAAAAARYRALYPGRSADAAADVAACLAAWEAQGLLRPPEPDPEAALLRRLARPPLEAAQSPAQRLAFGLPVQGQPAPLSLALDIADPELGRIVADLMADFPPPPGPPQHRLQVQDTARGWVLDQDGVAIRLAPNRVAARGQIVAELMRLAGGAAGWLATIHGAVLRCEAGSVFLAGASGAGKSTLAAGLVARGWQLLAEDLAGFDSAMAVWPLPFAPSLKAGAVAALRHDYPALAGLRAHRLGPREVRYHRLPPDRRATGPARPALVLNVAWQRDFGPAPAQLERLSPVAALALFMNEESYVDFQHSDIDAFFAFIVQTPAFELRYNQIDRADAALRHCLGAGGVL